MNIGITIGKVTKPKHLDYLVGEILTNQVVRVFNNKLYLLNSAVTFPFISENFEVELALGKWIEILTPPNFDDVNYLMRNGAWREMPQPKKTYFIEISFAGGNFSNASGYWFGISNYGGKYNQTYSANASFTPLDNFSAFNQFFGYHERVPIDCKVKKVHVFMANNGATYNLDLAILNYKITETFLSFASSGVYDRFIIARQQFVSNLGGFNKTMSDENVENDFVLSKGSFNRLFINTGGSTNAPIQNPMVLIEVEEI